MSSEIRDINLAESGEQKIEWVKRNCDLLRMLEEEFSRTKPFAGKKITLSVHLEAKTAYLCKVLAAGGALFDGTLTVEQAENLVENDLASLQAAADRVLQANGADYGAKVEVARDFFPTRTYADDVTLPAGVYTAVRVTLGSGAGQNWWCVMFPPLCLPAAEGETALSDVLSSAETDVVEKNPRLEPRFKLVELFEKIAEKFR